MDFYQQIGQAIRHYRELRGMTQSQLAQLAGVQRPRLTLIEAGTANAQLDTLIKISNALDCRLIVAIEAASTEAPAPSQTTAFIQPGMKLTDMDDKKRKVMGRPPRGK